VRAYAGAKAFGLVAALFCIATALADGSGDPSKTRYVGGAANVTGIGLMIFGPIARNLHLIRQYPKLI